MVFYGRLIQLWLSVVSCFSSLPMTQRQHDLSSLDGWAAPIPGSGATHGVELLVPSAKRASWRLRRPQVPASWAWNHE